MLGLSMCLQPFTIDPYLASYPDIEADFDVSTALIQFSLTGVTLGFAFGQIFAGTLSDSIGRRRPMIFAVSLYAVAAFAILWATNIETFIAPVSFTNLTLPKRKEVQLLGAEIN